MRATVALLIIFLTTFVAAHPFVIVHTHVTQVEVYQSTPTHHYVRPRDLLDDLESMGNSLLGISDDTTTSDEETTTASVKTLAPPVVATTTESTKTSKSSNTSHSKNEATATQSSTSSMQTSTSTSASASSTTPANSQDSALPSSNSDDSDDGVPPGGIAVAVIMTLLIVAIAAWLVFKYHPKCQAWWAAREQRKFLERSYREAIDNPRANGLSNSGQKGPMGGSNRQTMLKSFFAPATVKLGEGKEIRRKPVNWGATSPETPGPQPIDGEKISMTASAAPMGVIERYSILPETIPATKPTTLVSPVSLRPMDDLERLPPISPLSHRSKPSTRTVDRSLPPLPPVPTLPGLTYAKRGSNGVFRLK